MSRYVAAVVVYILFVGPALAVKGMAVCIWGLPPGDGQINFQWKHCSESSCDDVEWKERTVTPSETHFGTTNLRAFLAESGKFKIRFDNSYAPGFQEKIYNLQAETIDYMERDDLVCQTSRYSYHFERILELSDGPGLIGMKSGCPVDSRCGPQ